MATSIISVEGTTNYIENIVSKTSYAAGITSADITYAAYKMGKLVIVPFIINNDNLIPSTAWGVKDLVTGLPFSNMTKSSYVHGLTVQDGTNIPFLVEVSNTTLRIRRYTATSGSATMPTGFGGTIVYFTD